MAYAIIDKNPAVRQIVIDADSDLTSIKKERFAPGSTVFSIGSSNTFMLSNAMTWETITDEPTPTPTSTV